MNKVKKSQVAALKCCVPLCPSSSRKNRSITYHRFPKRRKFKEEWITALTDMEMYSDIVGKEGPAGLSRLFICSRHFAEEDFQGCPSLNTKSGQRSLKDNAIPSVFFERTVKRKSTQYDSAGPLQVKQNKGVNEASPSNWGSLISENREVPIATVALCMKKAVTTFKMALQNFEKDKEQNTSKSQNILPPEPPSVIDVNAISIRSTRSTKPFPPPESKVTEKQEEMVLPLKTVVKQAKKKVKVPSKSCNSQSNLDKRVTRTLANKVTPHELTQCTSVSKIENNSKTLAEEPDVKSISRRRTSVGSGSTSRPSVKSSITLRRLPGRKSEPPAVSSEKTIKLASPVQFKKADKKVRKSASALKIERNKAIEKVKQSLLSSPLFRKPKPDQATLAKLLKPADFVMPRAGAVSDDSERKQAGFVQSMFSQVITKVFADAVSKPRRKRRTTKTFIPDKGKQKPTRTDYDYDSSSSECQDNVNMIEGNPPWEIDGTDSQTVNGNKVYKHQVYNNDVKLEDYQLVDMNVDSDDEDDDGESTAGDPLSNYQNNVTTRIVKMDMDENEYGTPLLNGFGFDMDSNHDGLGHGVRNSPGKELMITPEGCEYASDASEGADDNYYALIPKIEVNEEESVEGTSHGQPSTSRINGVKGDVDDDVQLAANTQVNIKTEVYGS